MKGAWWLALCSAVGTASAASLETPRGIAQEAATVTAIKRLCPGYVPVDTGFAETLQGTILMDGIRKIGKEPFMRLVTVEQSGIRSAIDAAGPAAWCRRQKGRLEAAYPDVFRR